MSTQSNLPTADSHKGKWWLWIAVSLLFLVIITAWTWLIFTANSNLPELIPPPNQQP